MDITARSSGPALVLQVNAPRIDAAAAIAFKDRAIELADPARRHVVLDLASVTFIDSSGLGAVVGLMKHLAPKRQLTLANLKPNVMRVMQLTHLDRVIPIVEFDPAGDVALPD